MRQALLLAVACVGLVGFGVWGDCNCTPVQSGVPECYTAFWTGETVSFRLVVPGEYFGRAGSSQAVFLVGWRIETLDGALVTQDLFPEVPLGHWYVMAWDERDSSCRPVPAGYYRAVVMTDSAGEFSSYVRDRREAVPCSLLRAAALCSRSAARRAGLPTWSMERDGGSPPCSFSISVQIGCGCPVEIRRGARRPEGHSPRGDGVPFLERSAWALLAGGPAHDGVWPCRRCVDGRKKG